jgi:hypothetical protein
VYLGVTFEVGSPLRGSRVSVGQPTWSQIRVSVPFSLFPSFSLLRKFVPAPRQTDLALEPRLDNDTDAEAALFILVPCCPQHLDPGRGQKLALQLRHSQPRWHGKGARCLKWHSEVPGSFRFYLAPSKSSEMRATNSWHRESSQ